MSNTFDDYIVAVKSKYEVKKNKIYSDFLLKPSPAQLREFCLLIHDNGMSKKDNEVFELFFKIKPDSTLRKAIENIDLEKFKKICNFLNGKSLSTSQNSLNLIAILVNYENRPFSHFLKSENLDKYVVIQNRNKPNYHEETLIDEQETIKILPSKNLKKKVVIGFLGIIGIVSIGFTAKNIIAPEPQCMQWQKNHYEVVDCTNENKQGLDIVPFDEQQSKLIRIEVSDTTTFFKNEKSIYWYCKVNGKPEFFNTHGIHPVSGNALKPVTQYIVDKYVK